MNSFTKISHKYFISLKKRYFYMAANIIPPCSQLYNNICCSLTLLILQLVVLLDKLSTTTVVVESLSNNTTKCTVPENTSLLQDLINSMRNLHQLQPVLQFVSVHNIDYISTMYF